MPLIRRLRTRLILLLLGLLALVLAAVYFAVYSSTNASAERQAHQQLEIGAKVFQRLLELKASELTNATQVLVADFGFREAVATGDLPTIGSALSNQAERIGASQALLLDDQGQVRIASSGRDTALVAPVIGAVEPFGDDALLAIIGGEPYLLVSALVRAPMPIGQVAMAFELDQALAAEMKSLTGLEVGFSTLQNGKLMHQAATLSGFAPSVDVGEGGFHRAVDSTDYMGIFLTLLQSADQQVIVELLSPLGVALAAFDGLKRELAVITLVTLVLSSLAAVVLASSLSRPVSALASAAKRIGAGDYDGSVQLARQDELGVLGQSLDQMRRGIAEREQLLLHNAFHDPLTGLANLANLRERLDSALQSGYSGTLSLLALVDADRLIATDGQARYEQAMGVLADRLERHKPAGCFAAFQPGQGFVLLLERSELDRSVIEIDALLGLLSEPVELDGLSLRLGWLAGLVEWPRQGRDSAELLRQVSIARADAVPGRDRIMLYQANTDLAHLRRMRIIRDLPHAAGHGELSLMFQPKLDLQTGAVHQVEALLRWTHPELGPVRPDEFILLAEQTGSIHLLTQWVLEAVIAQVARWNRIGLRLQVAINLSARDLQDPCLPERVNETLQGHGVTAEQLSMEITESALMDDPVNSLLHLQRLRLLGIDLAVDDYGSGYSSLAMLKRLPVQDLKIDKAFILNLASDAEDATIVHSTIELAHNMGLRVVAEGIEDEQSLDWLRAQGCDTGQGYFISRPLGASQLQDWLTARISQCEGQT